MKLYVLVGDDWSNWEQDVKAEDFYSSLEVARAAAVSASKRVLELDVNPVTLHEQQSWTTRPVVDGKVEAAKILKDMNENINRKIKESMQRDQWPPYWARYTWS